MLHDSSPGGRGGHRFSSERDPDKVLADIHEGKISAGYADAHYGVVLKNEKVDAAASESRRAGLRSARQRQSKQTAANSAKVS